MNETICCPLCGEPLALPASGAGSLLPAGPQQGFSGGQLDSGGGSAGPQQGSSGGQLNPGGGSVCRLSAFGRYYWLCTVCDLLFMDTANRLDSDAELRRYALHQNRSDDAGYLRFLDRLRRPVLAELQCRGLAPAETCILADGSTRALRGLDYGSGPQPVLAELFRQDGWQLDGWDPNFAPVPPPGWLDGGGYDFILCCEVAEHFRQPLQDFRRMLDLLAPGGFLALMTGLRPAASCSGLEGWSYLSDATHVSLYSRKTFEWLARHLELTARFPAENVLLLEKRLA